jgi:hypothetical protein
MRSITLALVSLMLSTACEKTYATRAESPIVYRAQPINNPIVQVSEPIGRPKVSVLKRIVSLVVLSRSGQPLFCTSVTILHTEESSLDMVSSGLASAFMEEATNYQTSNPDDTNRPVIGNVECFTAFKGIPVYAVCGEQIGNISSARTITYTVYYTPKSTVDGNTCVAQGGKWHDSSN